jgi:Fe-S cluster assembly iron-binding protein IscA
MLTITDKASTEIKKAIDSSPIWADAKKGGADIFVRIGVISDDDDFQYTFQITSEKDSGDLVCEHGGLKFICDQESKEKVKGTTIDFVDDGNLVGISFDKK